MKAYSQDLRERVLRAVDQGIPRSEIVRVLGVSLATIGRYLKRRREKGHVRPKAIPGRPSKKIKPLQAGLQAQLEAFPDATLAQHCQYWQQTQRMQVSRWSMSRAIKGLYARAPKGKRAYGSVPRNRGKNMTLIAGLSRQGMTASMILDGAANGVAFEIYMEQILAPSLTAGQIVVMDNLSIHKGAKVRSAIEARGCQLLFLTGYSPDLSPIEEAFSKLKAALRRASARTREALEEAICQAVEVITAQDARGWFAHCGYLPAESAPA